MLKLISEETDIANLSMVSSIDFWFFLSVEFLIGITIYVVLAVLNLIKRFLPKPPRDLTGDVVLIIGVSTTFGKFLAEEFIKGGCSVICVDDDLQSLKDITAKIRSRYHQVKEIGPEHRERESGDARPIIAGYKCDLLDHSAICKIAKKVKDEVGDIDILVTCVSQFDQDMFEMFHTTFMSYYSTMSAFLPYMLRRGQKEHIVGIISIMPMCYDTLLLDLLENIGQELSNHNSCLTFLVISLMKHGSMTKSEQQEAKEVVLAIRRGQYTMHISWYSEILYRLSRIMYDTITMITQ